MIKLRSKQFCYNVGVAVSKLMELIINVLFWSAILLLSITMASLVFVVDQVKREPRLLGVAVYITLGLWLGASLLDGGVIGISRLPSGF